MTGGDKKSKYICERQNKIQYVNMGCEYLFERMLYCPGSGKHCYLRYGLQWYVKIAEPSVSVYFQS